MSLRELFNFILDFDFVAYLNNNAEIIKKYLTFIELFFLVGFLVYTVVIFYYVIFSDKKSTYKSKIIISIIFFIYISLVPILLYLGIMK